MEGNKRFASEVKVEDLIRVLLHRAWLIIMIGVLGVAAAWGISTYILEPTYTSTAKMYVINRQNEDKTTLADLQTGVHLTKDFKILVKSRPVMEEVIKKLNLDISPGELSASVNVNIPTETRILEISVTNHDATLAKEIADTIVLVASSRLVEVMEIEKINTVELGNLPRTPSSPNRVSYMLQGGLGGIILISFILSAMYLRNDSIKNVEDIEKYLGLTTLGIIPMEEVSKKSKKKVRVRKQDTKVLAS